MKILLAAIFSGLTAAPLLASAEGWSNDFAAAQKQAAATNKDLLIDFTGSDWCGWCIKLDKEVFSHQPFKDGVKDHFVLVELDYPNDKSKLSEATLKQNEELAKKYAVEGYPTILLCDASGKPYAATGYQEGGPEAYVKHLNQLRTRKAAADETLKSAASLEGLPKAQALVAMLAQMDLTDRMVENFYGDLVAQIKTADPTDQTGFQKKTLLKEKLSAFQKELSFFAQSDDFAAALTLVDETIKNGGFEKPEVQQMMATRAVLLAQMKKFDEALHAVDDAKAFAPDSELAAGLDDFKKKLQAAKEMNSSPAPAK